MIEIRSTWHINTQPTAAELARRERAKGYDERRKATVERRRQRALAQGKGTVGIR